MYMYGLPTFKRHTYPGIHACMHACTNLRGHAHKNASQVDPLRSRALEQVLILYLDHEQNASTSTVRTAGSSQANPFACVASGIAALWGPAHGGATEVALGMLQARPWRERAFVGALRAAGLAGARSRA